MTDLRKLLIEARERIWIHWNGDQTSADCKIIERIDAALVEPVEPVAWVKSSELDDALKKRQSFNGWRIKYDDCDMALYAAPADQDRERLDWLEDCTKCYWVTVQTQPSANHIYAGQGAGLREAIDRARSAKLEEA